MNKFLNDLERKIGKYAIVNLTKYIVMLYAAGYVLQLAPQNVNITGYLTLDPYLILHGQVWRLVSWLLIPPGSFSLLFCRNRHGENTWDIQIQCVYFWRNDPYDHRFVCDNVCVSGILWHYR